MREKQNYTRDLAEIRSMMVRSSKFLSLSGWSGVLAGIYALAGAYIAWKLFNFTPGEMPDISIKPGSVSLDLMNVIFLALTVLVLSVGTAIFLSGKKADKRGENLWNSTSKQLLINLAVPLVAGGLLILVLLSKGLTEFLAPFSLVFYGLALYNAGKFTYGEVKTLGIIEIGLGLISTYFIEYGLLFWAVGFGVFHIIYGIYIHYRYER